MHLVVLETFNKCARTHLVWHLTERDQRHHRSIGSSRRLRSSHLSVDRNGNSCVLLSRSRQQPESIPRYRTIPDLVRRRRLGRILSDPHQLPAKFRALHTTKSSKIKKEDRTNQNKLQRMQIKEEVEPESNRLNSCVPTQCKTNVLLLFTLIMTVEDIKIPLGDSKSIYQLCKGGKKELN